MRGIPLNKMPVKDLRESVNVFSGGHTNSAIWSKELCIAWLTERHIDKINGVGNFCKALLRVVVGKNEDGYAVGLSYSRMVRVVKKHFPHSVADENHLCWYATTMRADREVIPVYREKNK